jgi:hypothetical protein
MKVSEFFAKLGGSCWFIGAGVSILVLILAWTDVIGLRDFPWRSFLMIFGISGFAAMLVAGLFGIWEAD